MQRKLEHGGAVNFTLPGKVFQFFKEGFLAAEGNHMERGHMASMPPLLAVCK